MPITTSSTQALIRLSDGLAVAVKTVGMVGAWSVIFLIGVTLYDVLLRRFFDVGSSQLQELEWHIHTVLFSMSLGYAYLANAHIRVDLWRENWSDRTNQMIELAGCVVFLIPFVLIIFYFGVQFAWKSFLVGESSAWAHGLGHRWVIKSFIPIGAFLWLLAGISVVVRMIVALWGASPVENDSAGVGRGAA